MGNNNVKRELTELEKIAFGIEIQLEGIQDLIEHNNVSDSIHAIECVLRDAKEISKLILRPTKEDEAA